MKKFNFSPISMILIIFGVFSSFRGRSVSGYKEAMCVCHPRIYRHPFSYVDIVEDPPPFEMSDCDKELECVTICKNVFDTMGGGDFSFELSSGGMTMGDYLCGALLQRRNGTTFEGRPVKLFSKLCDGRVEFAGKQSREGLCCSGAQFRRCL